MREVSAGVKFKDIDLIGIPLKIIIGKSYEDGYIELKLRYEEQSKLIDASNLESIYNEVIQKLDEYNPVKALKI